ncbi:hypothetical protein HHK36_020186 [Tetracentron sinense]|uniref:Disease resistance protein RPM1-like n=1 Tax=Tetracentron sinense TaxID=13715 RepID=A0A834YR65_TETSI|nr:hypothetical protein HHK36_020186 [Tetracentron sinense]
MAESAVTFVLDRIVPLLDEEFKLLRDVRGELEYIRDELQSIRGFLRDADAKEESEEAVKAWVDQVRNIAYDIEDICDEFTFCLPPQHQRHGFVGSLHKTAHFVKHLRQRHRLATQIQGIKARVHDVSERRARYDLKILDQGSSPNSTHDMWHDLRGDALLLEENELVGIHKPREKLIGWLVEGESRLELTSVYGMGGSGKTTLVKKVYDHQKVKDYFHHHAWINVSQSFKINELLKDMIKQLFSEIKQTVPQGVDTMDEITLKMTVKEFLQQKRYVVILDDIWSINPWEAVKYALPDSNCGSRIMVTTRSSYVASSCKEPHGHIHNMESLAPKDCWALFCKKAFGENSCPPELQGHSENILKRCGGLPLAIVTIGSVLSTKEKTQIEWVMVYRSLGSLLESNDKLKIGIGSLVNLQELFFIDVNQGGGVVRELGKLSQLRRLGILGLREEDGPELCSSIEKMSNLRWLVVTSLEQKVIDLQCLSSPPLHLQYLELAGKHERFPNWISSLNNVKMIHLRECRLRDDPLKVLQALPNLVKLSLHWAYDGDELCFKTGGFQKLKTIYLSKLERLKLVTVEEGAMHHLEVINIEECKMLEKLPLGIECLTNLKFFDFADMRNEFTMALSPNIRLGGRWMRVNWKEKLLKGHSLE